MRVVQRRVELDANEAKMIAQDQFNFPSSGPGRRTWRCLGPQCAARSALSPVPLRRATQLEVVMLAPDVPPWSQLAPIAVRYTSIEMIIGLFAYVTMNVLRLQNMPTPGILMGFRTVERPLVLMHVPKQACKATTRVTTAAARDIHTCTDLTMIRLVGRR